MVVQRCNLVEVNVYAIEEVLDVGLEGAAVGEWREVEQQNCFVGARLFQGLDLCRSPLVVELLIACLSGDLVAFY